MGSLQIDISSIRDFTGRVVIVTGGSSGLGLSILRLLASKGATIINFDVAEPPVDCIETSEWIKIDVSDWKDQKDGFKYVLAKHGHIDIVFANAGVAEGEMAFEDNVEPDTGDPVEPAWSTLKINLLGQLITTKLAVHYMRKSTQGGSIVLSASRSSYMGYAMPVYTTTKHGILGLLRGLRLHMPQYNIRINAIAPHVTDSGMTEGSRQLFAQAGMAMQSGYQVALAGVYLAQESSLNGKCIDITQGKYRELEDKIDELRWEIFGKDDLQPETEKEIAAVLSVQTTRW